MQVEITHAKVILFKESGKYYTEERWEIPEKENWGPHCMQWSPGFHRIGNGKVYVKSQEPWGFPVLL